MGVENNECVIATTWDSESMNKLKLWVSTLDSDIYSLFVFVPALMNGKETMFLAPDGSKKGWSTAKEVAAIRDALIDKLNELAFEDGSSPFDWVEVGYGEYGQAVLRGNCKNMYNDKVYAEQR